jgi:preprotein translocase subunit SecF
MSKKIPNIDFIKNTKYALTFSIIITILSIILLFFKGLNFSIDFKGGTIIEFSTAGNNVEDNLRELLINQYDDVEIHKNKLGDSNICCNYNLKIGIGKSNIIDNVTAVIKNTFSDTEFIKIDYIGPKIGANFMMKFSYGVMLALLHDVLITLGFFSLTGFQFDLTSIAVILTIIGYSINDSIVIYDRIRENLKANLNKIHKNDLIILINRSINETLSRTIMTSLTTLVVSIALLIFGGETLRSFSAGLSFGIAFGTYSSIYISAPVLIFFSKK